MSFAREEKKYKFDSAKTQEKEYITQPIVTQEEKTSDEQKEVAAQPDEGKILKDVLLSGDLSKLTDKQQAKYYIQVCKSVGLNPLTKPFEFITLNRKLVLYAKRDCTDQLRSIHNVSVTEMTQDDREGVHIVTVKVQNGQGRTDMATGAVNIANLKGDNLANALMKTETKAKRRATLSICGLGLLDETEIETIPNAQPMDITPVENSREPTQFTSAGLRNTFCKNVLASFEKAKTAKELVQLWMLNTEKLDAMEESKNGYDELGFANLKNQYDILLERFEKNPDPTGEFDMPHFLEGRNGN